jgi:predicted GNAT superfamily acetyltransferase
MSEQNITIRALKSLDDMYEAVALQRLYWGDDVESLVPAHMLFTIASYGGHILAAFDGTRMIGVLIGLVGTAIDEVERPAMANLLIASKRMVVLPEYRSGGVGYRLKLAQREAAIKQGIRLVTWTFDPLRSANAYLNLRKLGGVCEKYQQDVYGTRDGSGLAVFGMSDRLKVDWWVTNRRVEERINGSRPDLTLIQYLSGNARIINPTRQESGERFATPAPENDSPNGSFALVEIPLNFGQMIDEVPDLAQRWQHHIRGILPPLMSNGYAVTDFLRTDYEGRDRGFYLLSFNSGYDYRLN